MCCKLVILVKRSNIKESIKGKGEKEIDLSMCQMEITLNQEMAIK